MAQQPMVQSSDTLAPAINDVQQVDVPDGASSRKRSLSNESGSKKQLLKKQKPDDSRPPCRGLPPVWAAVSTATVTKTELLLIRYDRLVEP